MSVTIGSGAVGLLLCVLVPLIPGDSRAAEAAPPLVLERTIPLAGGAGRIDHMDIDPARRSVVSRTKLQAHPEGFRLDPAAPRAFVNVPDVRQIAVVNLATEKQVATWQVPGLGGNFPMAFDATNEVLATVYRSPARL